VGLTRVSGGSAGFDPWVPEVASDARSVGATPNSSTAGSPSNPVRGRTATLSTAAFPFERTGNTGTGHEGPSHTGTGALNVSTARPHGATSHPTAQASAPKAISGGPTTASGTQVVSDPLTIWGRSEGSRPIVTTTEPCVLFVGSRVDLIWTVQALGYKPTHVHVRDSSLLTLARKLVPTASIVTGATPEWRSSLPSVAFIQGYAQTFGFLF
jgi:hypothetical protein